MGRGTNETDPGETGSLPRRAPSAEPPWDGVEIKILCNRRLDGQVEVETSVVAYDIDCTRPDAELRVKGRQPPGPLRKMKLGEQLHRPVLAEIAKRLQVPYDEE